MGLQASIEITYSKNIDFISFWKLLLSNGWHYDDHNRITFILNDDYDWEDDVLQSFDKVFDKLKHRFSNNELIGIALLNDENIGGMFHFMPNKRQIMILVNINRKRILDTNQTDFTFYAKMLIPILDNVEIITYEDIT